MSFESCVSSLKDAIINHCSGLISTHNTDSNAHNNLFGWNSRSCGSYGTLYYNTALRLCFFIYVRQVAVSTTQTTVEAGVIPAEYRPLRDIISSTGHPKVHGGVTASGDVWSRATDSFTVGFSLTVMYPY